MSRPGPIHMLARLAENGRVWPACGRHVVEADAATTDAGEVTCRARGCDLEARARLALRARLHVAWRMP